MQPTTVYPAGTVIRQPQARPVSSPAQYVTAAPQYVTSPAASQGHLAAGSYSAPAPMTRAPAQYVTAGAPATRMMMPAGNSYVAAPGGGYRAAPQVASALATTVFRQAMPTSGLSGSVRVVQQPVMRTSGVTQVIQGGTQVRPNTLAGPLYTQGAYEQKHQDDPQLQNLKELRKTSGLKQVPVGLGLATLKARAVEGKLTREQFGETYKEILAAHSIEAPGEEVQNAVFDLFDRDDNNIVDMMELICGISLLCSGSEDDKIHAVFEVFDENGDGFISMDEMFKFLTSVFKVVLTPNVMAVMNSMGVTVESAEDLASVTSLECFKTADLNHDGKLSVTEFKNWFYAPRNDPSFMFSPVRNLLQ
mmetsp:Transcript_139162/g.444076  ORF Transcript_139162/g.444076 Transcript_139162/m.444076 type:complete len:362 (+) Transcript_139162:86-1171(+)